MVGRTRCAAPPSRFDQSLALGVAKPTMTVSCVPSSMVSCRAVRVTDTSVGPPELKVMVGLAGFVVRSQTTPPVHAADSA